MSQDQPKILTIESGIPFLRFVLHVFAAVPLSMVLGFFAELAVGRLYANTQLEPFFPAMASVAAAIGYLITKSRTDREALWVWIPPLLWFVAGFLSEAWGWNPTWDFHHSRWIYAYDNLLGSNCSDCLGELFCTAPLVCSIAYAVASWLALRTVRARAAKLITTGRHEPTDASTYN